MTLKDELGLPEFTRVVFDQPPLVLTICQVRFSPILSITKPAYVGSFQEALRNDYPLLTNVVHLQPDERQGVEIDADDEAIAQSWRFSDRHRTWTVTLAVDAITLESRRYLHFDDFVDRLRRLLEALTAHVRPTVGLRLGLRYINEIRTRQGTPQDAIRADLLGPLAVAPFGALAQHAMQQLLLRFGGGQSLHLRHGYLPQGTTVEPLPGEPTRTGPFYLLDIDTFHAFEPPEILEMEPATICSMVGEFHDAIEALFRWSITDRYAATLGVSDDA